MLYDSPIRAAEQSRTGRAMSETRFSVIVDGKKRLAQVIYHKGQYSVTYAGLLNTRVRFANVNELVDKVKKWRPL